MAQISELTTLESYKLELSKSGLVVIDFYSTQCPPCKVVAPFYEKIAEKFGNENVRFFKVNGLQESGYVIQQAAGVVWWPTFVIYKKGKETWREKVPNPPSLQPIKDLEKYLDDQRRI